MRTVQLGGAGEDYKLCRANWTDFTDCGTERRDRGGCVFEQEAKHGQIPSQQRFGEELLLLALKGGAQSGWPRMIPLLFHLCHLINFLWQVLNKVI